MKKYLVAVCIGLLLFASLGCTEEEGPAEKIGKKIDKTISSTKEESQSALDKFNEDANQAFSDVKEKVNQKAAEIGEGLTEAKDTVVDKVEELTN